MPFRQEEGRCNNMFNMLKMLMQAHHMPVLTEKEWLVTRIINAICWLMCCCYLSIIMLNYELTMKALTVLSNFITDNVSIILTVLSVVAIAAAYLIAYTRAGSFGIPIRYVRANVHESIEVILLTVFVISCGVVVPSVLFTSALPSIDVWIAASINVTIGYGIVLNHYIKAAIKLWWHPKKQRKKKWKIAFEITCYICIILLGIYFGYIVSVINGYGINSAAAMFGLHLLIIMALFFSRFLTRITGTFTSEIICKVDDIEYLVGVRHAGGVWTLHKCKTGTTDVCYGYRDTIYYERGKYILKALNSDDVKEHENVEFCNINQVADINSVKEEKFRKRVTYR